MLYYDLGKGGNGWSKQSWARHDMGADAYLCCPGPSLKNANITRGRGRKVFAINTAYPKVIPDVWMGLDTVECYDRNIWGESFAKVCRGNYTDMEVDDRPIKYFDNVFFASIKEPPKGKTMLDLITHDAPLVWHKNTLAAMLHLIIKMGAKNIYLVGCDMGGNSSYYDDRKLPEEQKNYNQRLYNSQVKFIKDIAEKAKLLGINIISSTYITPLNRFLPYKPLNQAIKESEEKVKVESKPVLHCLDAHKKIAVIVPTRGNRPQFLEQCTEMIKYQTKQPDKIYIIDRKPKNDENDQRDRIEEGIELARKDGIDRVIIFEDDDYYPPTYIETVLTNWKYEHVIGFDSTCVYYLREKRYYAYSASENFKWNNNEGSPLHSTSFTIEAWDKFVKTGFYRKHKNLDMELWKWAVKENVKRKLIGGYSVISMKHNLGMCGCNHNRANSKFKKDFSSDWLKQNTNEKFHDFYIFSWDYVKPITEKKKKVILHTNNYAELGGIETTVLDIAKSMPQYQHILCTVRTNLYNKEFIKYVEEQGIIHQLGMIEECAEKYKPDLVIMHNTHLFKDVLPGYKILTAHHGVQKPFSSGDYNWFVSDWVRNGYDNVTDNSITLPPPVFPDELLRVTRPDRTPVIGRIQSSTWARMGKTTQTFYDSIKQVKGCDYFIVGLDVPKEFPSAPIMYGKMAEYLSKIDIMAIWGDTTETWSKVTTEANLSGIPVVARNHNDGLAEQLRKSGGGILVNTPEEFVETIQFLVDNPHERDSLAQRGREYALRNSTTTVFKEFFLDKVLPIIENKADNLIDLCSKYNTDKNTVHSYIESYDRLFLPFKDRPINLFEVGYYKGDSAHLFAEYFSKGLIKSIDINNAPAPTNSRVIFDKISIRDIKEDYFKDFIPDIAIDDGSHKLEDQLYFVSLLYPIIKKDGLLIVEDIQSIEHIKEFEKLGFPFKTIDLRSIKNRYDDILLVFKK